MTGASAASESMAAPPSVPFDANECRATPQRALPPEIGDTDVLASTELQSPLGHTGGAEHDRAALHERPRDRLIDREVRQQRPICACCVLDRDPGSPLGRLDPHDPRDGQLRAALRAAEATKALCPVD